MNRTLLVLALILSSVSAFNITYDSRIIASPNKPISIPVYVFSDKGESVSMTCLGNVEVFCPAVVEIPAGIEKPVYIKLVPQLGENKIYFKMGGQGAEIHVLGSNQTIALLSSLQKLNSTFNNLENKYGKNQIIDLAKALIKEGQKHYSQKEYIATQGIIENSNRLLDEYYSQIIHTPKEEVEEPARLNLGVVPLFLMTLGFGIYWAKTRKKKPKEERDTGIEALAKIIKNEIGAV